MSFSSFVWMFLVPLVAILLPIWLGHIFGERHKKRGGSIPEGPVGSTVGATLGLSAFMLAFTFSIVSGRYDKRKELLFDEISQIRSVYLFAGLVPEPIRTATRQRITEYVDVRVKFSKDPSKYDEVKKKSFIILDTLWSYSEKLAEMDRSSEAYSLYMSAVNEIYNRIKERIIISSMRIPRTILYVLCIVTFLSMFGLGFQFGMSGKRTLFVQLLLASTFAVVMWLIAALDHPESGLVPLSDKPLHHLYDELHPAK